MSERLGSPERVSVVEFGPEMAGQQVGWVSVNRFETEDDRREEVLQVGVAYATVAQEGAKFGYWRQPGEEDAGFLTSHGDGNRGFRNCTSIDLTVMDGQVVDRAFSAAPGFPSRQEYAKSDVIILPRFALDAGGGPGVDPAKWERGGESILGSLKRQLAEHGIEHVYGKAYYLLAAAGSGDSLLADPEMREETRKQHALISLYEGNLARVQNEDVGMLRDLTIFGEVPADDLADHFEKSRRTVHRLEGWATSYQDKSQIGELLLPIGFRPAGRSWPYMDAARANPAESYGRELAGLQRRSIEPAWAELHRETGELGHRIANATRFKERLAYLYELEDVS